MRSRSSAVMLGGSSLPRASSGPVIIFRAPTMLLSHRSATVGMEPRHEQHLDRRDGSERYRRRATNSLLFSYVFRVVTRVKLSMTRMRRSNNAEVRKERGADVSLSGDWRW